MQNKQNNKLIGVRVVLLLCLLGSAGVVHAMPGEGAGEAGIHASLCASLPASAAADGSVAVAHAQPDIAGLGQPVSYARLDEVRGGFDLGDGLLASLGIQELTYINGNLVTSTSINIPNIGQITAQQATALASALSTVNLVQNGPRNIIEPSSIGQNNVAVTPSQGKPNNSAASSSIGQNNVAVTSSQGKPNNSAASPSPGLNSDASTVVQNTPNNAAAQSSLIQNAGLATVIQNSLNNQSISTLTTLNISVNTLDVLHELNLQSTLQAAQQLSLSLGH